MNISYILHARTLERPEQTAIIDARHGRVRHMTFAQLETAAAKAAALLHQSGLRMGDGVLLLQPIGADLYATLAALFRLGLVAVFIDPSAGIEHIEHCCAMYPIRGLVAGSKAHLLRWVSPAVRRIPVKFSIGTRVPGAVNWAQAVSLPPLDQIEDCPPDTAALITFTSGSTAAPKATVRSHHFLIAQHKSIEARLNLEAGEMELSTLPIFVLANLASGVTSFLPDVDLAHPASLDPGSLIAHMKEFRITRTSASPALLETLADFCTKQERSLMDLRKVFVGGAPVFPHLLAKLASIAPNAEIVSVYGSTEAEPIATLSHQAVTPGILNAMLAGKGLLAGDPVPGIKLRILADRWGTSLGSYTEAEFATACLPAGYAGEIVVSGNHVLTGYLHGIGNEENKFLVGNTGWHRTGDAGYLDDRGRLWLLGRCSARIRDGYGTLYPFSVECAAHHLPCVRRAAVICNEGRRVLLIEPRGRDQNKLSHLEPIFARFHIDHISFLKKIPVDSRHNAKVDYSALRRVLSKQQNSSSAVDVGQ